MAESDEFSKFLGAGDSRQKSMDREYFTSPDEPELEFDDDGTELSASKEAELDAELDEELAKEAEGGAFRGGAITPDGLIDEDFEKELGTPAEEDGPTEFSDVERYGIVEVAGDDLYGRKVIVISACKLPSNVSFDHQRLLLYIKHTLDKYVEQDYVLVYFHHGLNRGNKPKLSWLMQAYREFDRKYKKNLKMLYLVHPTNFIKVLWQIFKPFISVKFGQKMMYVNYLMELKKHLPFDQLAIPLPVLDTDMDSLDEVTSLRAQTDYQLVMEQVPPVALRSKDSIHKSLSADSGGSFDLPEGTTSPVDLPSTHEGPDFKVISTDLPHGEEKLFLKVRLPDLSALGSSVTSSFDTEALAVDKVLSTEDTVLLNDGWCKDGTTGAGKTAATLTSDPDTGVADGSRCKDSYNDYVNCCQDESPVSRESTIISADITYTPTVNSLTAELPVIEDCPVPEAESNAAPKKLIDRRSCSYLRISLSCPKRRAVVVDRNSCTDLYVKPTADSAEEVITTNGHRDMSVAQQNCVRDQETFDSLPSDNARSVGSLHPRHDSNDRPTIVDNKIDSAEQCMDINILKDYISTITGPGQEVSEIKGAVYQSETCNNSEGDGGLTLANGAVGSSADDISNYSSHDLISSEEDFLSCWSQPGSKSTTSSSSNHSLPSCTDFSSFINILSRRPRMSSTPKKLLESYPELPASKSEPDLSRLSLGEGLSSLRRVRVSSWGDSLQSSPRRTHGRHTSSRLLRRQGRVWECDSSPEGGRSEDSAVPASPLWETHDKTLPDNYCPFNRFARSSRGFRSRRRRVVRSDSASSLHTKNAPHSQPLVVSVDEVDLPHTSESQKENGHHTDAASTAPNGDTQVNKPKRPAHLNCLKTVGSAFRRLSTPTKALMGSRRCTYDLELAAMAYMRSDVYTSHSLSPNSFKRRKKSPPFVQPPLPRSFPCSPCTASGIPPFSSIDYVDGQQPNLQTPNSPKSNFASSTLSPRLGSRPFSSSLSASASSLHLLSTRGRSVSVDNCADRRHCGARSGKRAASMASRTLPAGLNPSSGSVTLCDSDWDSKTVRLRKISYENNTLVRCGNTMLILDALFDGKKVERNKVPYPYDSTPGKEKKAQQFGLTLQSIKENTGLIIPLPVEDTIEFLKATGGDECEGLFRRCARVSTMREVQERYDDGEKVNFYSYGDPHLAAAILKKFLRELKEPLMTFDLFEPITRLHFLEASKQLQEVQRILQDELPEDNYIILKFIFQFLQRVVSKCDLNKMNAENIATVFGPNIAWPMGQANLTTVEQAVKFALILVNNFDDVFLR